MTVVSPSIARGTIHVGDALEVLRELPSEAIDQVVTSPPYYRLRDYQVKGQVGIDGSVDRWVAQVLDVANEVERVLVPTGTFWLNVGDTFSRHHRDGAQSKSLLLAPERLALAMITRGWRLRSKVIWHKPNPRPSSVRDRFTSSWEYLYVFAKAPRYFFDLDSVRIPATSTGTRRAPPRDAPPVRERWRGSHSATGDGLRLMHQRGISAHPLGKNPGDVWRIPSSHGHGAHHATYPVELARRAIAAGCPERRCARCHAPYARPLKRTGIDAVLLPLIATCECEAPSEPGLVCDPFIGSGTTAIAARALKRDWLGIELNPDFAAAARARIDGSPP